MVLSYPVPLLLLLALFPYPILPQRTNTFIANTGISLDGATKLANSLPDPHWKYYCCQASKFIAAVPPTSWVPATTGFMSPLPKANGLVGTTLTSTVNHQLYWHRFNLTRPVASFNITLKDDDTAFVFLNGHQILSDPCPYQFQGPGCSPNCCFNAPHTLTITSGLVIGINDIWLAVPNIFGGSGLVAEFGEMVYAPISGTNHPYSTGQSASGTPLPASSLDPRWSRTSTSVSHWAYNAGMGATTASGASWTAASVGGWAVLTATSAAPLNGPNGAYSGYYLYRTQFNVSFPSASLAMQYSTDDFALVFLNGVNIFNDTCIGGPRGATACGPTLDCCWNSWQYATLNTFVMGVNELLFAVPNTGGGSGIFVVFPTLVTDVSKGDAPPLPTGSTPPWDAVPPTCTGYINAARGNSDFSWSYVPPGVTMDPFFPLAPWERTFATTCITTMPATPGTSAPLSGIDATFPGLQFYSTTFVVSNPTGAQLGFRLSSDDKAYLYLNGLHVVDDMDCGSSCWTSTRLFNITQGFQRGVNLLVVAVPNALGGSGMMMDRIALSTNPARATSAFNTGVGDTWGAPNGATGALIATGSVDNHWLYRENFAPTTSDLQPNDFPSLASWAPAKVATWSVTSPGPARQLAGPANPVSGYSLYKTTVFSPVASGGNITMRFGADDWCNVYINRALRFIGNTSLCFVWGPLPCGASVALDRGANEVLFACSNSVGAGGIIVGFFPTAFSPTPTVSPSLSATTTASTSATPSPPPGVSTLNLLGPLLSCATNGTGGVVVGARFNSGGATFVPYTTCTSGNRWSFDVGYPGAIGGYQFLSPSGVMANANASCGAPSSGTWFPSLLYTPRPPTPPLTPGTTVSVSLISYACFSNPGTGFTLQLLANTSAPGVGGNVLAVLGRTRSCLAATSTTWTGVLSGTVVNAVPYGGGIELLTDPLGSCNSGAHNFGPGGFTVTQYSGASTFTSSATALPTPTPGGAGSLPVVDTYYPYSLSCFDASGGLAVGWRNGSGVSSPWAPFPFCNPWTNTYHMAADYSVASGGYCNAKALRFWATNSPTSCSAPSKGWGFPSILHTLPAPLYPGSTITLVFIAGCNCGDGMRVVLRAFPPDPSSPANPPLTGTPILLNSTIIGAMPPHNTTPCIQGATVYLTATLTQVLPAGASVEVLGDPRVGCDCDGGAASWAGATSFQVKRVTWGGSTWSGTATASPSVSLLPSPSPLPATLTSTACPSTSPTLVAPTRSSGGGGGGGGGGTASFAPLSLSPSPSGSSGGGGGDGDGGGGGGGSASVSPPTLSPTTPPSSVASESSSACPSLTPTQSASSLPSPTSTLTLTSSPTQTPSITPSSTPTPTSTVTLGASSSPTPTPSITSTRTPTETPSITSTRTPTETPTGSMVLPTPSFSPSPSVSLLPSTLALTTPTVTPTASTSGGTPLPLATPSQTSSPGESVTGTPSITPSPSPSPSPSPTPSGTATNTASQGGSPGISAASTPTPTPTATYTPTTTVVVGGSGSSTITPSPSPSPSPSPTTTTTSPGSPLTPSFTGTPTSSLTQGASPSFSPTNSVSTSPSQTPTPSLTMGVSPSTSSSETLTGSPTQTPTTSLTLGVSASTTSTGSLTASPTPTPSGSVTVGASASTSSTSTLSGSPTSTPTSSITLGASASTSSTETLTASPTQTPTTSITLGSSASTSSTESLTASPTQTPTPSLTVGVSPSTSSTETLSGSPTQTPTPSLTQGGSASTSSITSLTASPTPTPSGSVTVGASASTSSTSSLTGSPTSTPTSSVTLGASASTSSTATLTASPTQTPTPSLSVGLSSSSTSTSTLSGSPTTTPTPSLTLGVSASSTSTSSLTGSPTQTPTASVSKGASPSTTSSSTLTGSPTTTPTPSLSAGTSPSTTSSATLTASPTTTPTTSATLGSSGSTTSTATLSASPSGTPSPTLSRGASPSTSSTATRSSSPTTTPTSTLTLGATSSTSSTQTLSSSPTGTPSPTLSVGASPSTTPSLSSTGSPTATLSLGASPSTTSAGTSILIPLTSTFTNAASTATAATVSNSSATPLLTPTNTLLQSPREGTVVDAAAAAASTSAGILAGAGLPMFFVGTGSAVALAGIVGGLWVALRKRHNSSGSGGGGRPLESRPQKEKQQQQQRPGTKAMKLKGTHSNSQIPVSSGFKTTENPLKADIWEGRNAASIQRFSLRFLQISPLHPSLPKCPTPPQTPYHLHALLLYHSVLKGTLCTCLWCFLHLLRFQRSSAMASPFFSIWMLLTPVGATLYDTLTSTPFQHAGVVRSTDTFIYEGRPCSYLEPENVTVAPAQGIGWTEGGSCPLLYACPTGGSCTGSCVPGATHADMDRPGGDYRAFQLPATPNGAACAAQCCGESPCSAWAYTATAPPGQEPSCAQGSPCCYLKSTAHDEVPTPGVFSGTVSRGPVALTHPPIGLRSSAPLGGVGAGAFELRGDGTVHEVTIVNQSPSGAAKYGVLADMVLGVRIGGVAKSLRTSPPPYAPGVASLTYSALYPLARLGMEDGEFGAGSSGVSAFAYSKLVPGDPTASAAPAVAFTLALSNSGSTPLNASLYLSIPLASVNDCSRAASGPSLLANLTGMSGRPSACLHACTAAVACASWTLLSSQEGGACLLASNVPLSVHREGAYCGVKGAWSSSADGSTLTLAMPCSATNGSSSSGSGPSPPPPSAACGDVTLKAVGPGKGSVGAAADPSAMWGDFAASGGFLNTSGGAGGLKGAAVGYGAASVSLTLPPGTNATLSLIFAWYFPHKDYDYEDIGNYYSTLWPDSGAVAESLAGEGALETAAEDLAAHHAVFVGPQSSLPPWLGDFLVNAMSHFRGMIWSRDGRMREYEANDCMDLDSIHNDYQRHLPYLWLMPQYEAQKLRKWGSGQAPEGYIQEFLGPFGLGPFDIPGGRIMGDTTTLWVVELMELWRSSGDGTLLDDLWPTAKRALGWLMTNAQPLGLPDRLYCSYDIVWLDSYNTTTYNSFLYLAALRAGEVLAGAVGDGATASTLAVARARGETALQELLWVNSDGAGGGGYYKAYLYNEESALMSDALYGAVIGFGVGLGPLAPTSQMSLHLAAEMTHNYDPFGFVTITNRTKPPPDGQHPDDTKLWGQAGPDWSSLTLQLLGTAAATGGGINVTAALDPAFRQLDNWRTRLASLWNLAGITTAQDNNNPDLSALPFCTAHYGFDLVAYWLVPALSGQLLDLPGGTLTFNPLLPCPYQLPFMAAAVEGTLGCNAEGGLTLTLAFGTLKLPAGGLNVSGRVYASAVNLGPGGSVNW